MTISERTPIRFEEISEQFENTDSEFIAFKEGKKSFCTPYILKSTPDEERNKSLFKYLSQIACLNKDKPMAFFISVANAANNNFQKKLPERELRAIINSVYNRLKSGKLKIYRGEGRRVIFNPKSNLTRVEKMAITNKIMGELKSEKTRETIKSFINSWDITTMGKITKARLCRTTKLHISTIKRHWETLKELVEEVNLKSAALNK